MNISFYTAAAGASQQQRRLDVHGNNISNVNNFGFRARVPEFSQLMTYNVRGITDTVRTGVGSNLESDAFRTNTTGYIDTEQPLDYAIEGDGFFCVEDPVTKERFYTRDGSFTVVQEGTGVNVRYYLTDAMGRYVLNQRGNHIRVYDPMNKLAIGVFDFENTDGMKSVGENRLSPVEKNGQPVRGTGNLLQYMVEASNVDLAYELSKVIETQRSFSFMLRMVTASDEIESTVNNLR